MKNKSIYWAGSPPKKMTMEQAKAFEWLRKIFKKKPEELTDHEREVQRLYKNTVIF